VAGSLLHALAAQQALAAEALALGFAAAVLPLVARRGRFGPVGAAALLLTVALLAAPSASALPLVVAAWLTWPALTLGKQAAT
jgi:hypothetical protein